MKVNIQSSLEEAIDLLEGYVDVKDSEGGPVPNDAMRAVRILEEVLDELKRFRIGGSISKPHRFSNRKEVRQQFVPGLKLGGGQ